MSFVLRDKAQHERWRQIADRLGGEFVQRSQRWTADVIRTPVGDHTVTLDLHILPGYKSEHHQTRLRLPYLRRNAFAFQVTRRRLLFTTTAATGGLESVLTGDLEFDKRFSLRASDPAIAKKLFDDPRIRELMPHHPGMILRTREYDPEMQSQRPVSFSELILEVPQCIERPKKLEVMHELIAAVFERLRELGQIDDQPPEVDLY